jgi:pyruvate,water dikinase
MVTTFAANSITVVVNEMSDKVSTSFVAWFEKLGRDDVARAGGKGANLGEMTRAELPVPPGFVVTADAYQESLEANDLREQIAARLRDLNASKTNDLRVASEEIQRWISARFHRQLTPEHLLPSRLTPRGCPRLHHFLQGNATELLKDGITVTVDGGAGAVYEGGDMGAEKEPEPAEVTERETRGAALVTATKLYVNLAVPAEAERVAALDVDGVGLLRAEFMIPVALDGRHPRAMIEEGETEQFIGKMADSLRHFAAAFAPRPVIYRTMDFRSNEVRQLKGGDKYEPTEQNPMLGYRGVFRYTREPDLFKLELEAIKRVRNEFDNLQIMLPFVRTTWELEECLKIMDEAGTRSRGSQLWVMAEVPSIVHRLDSYAALDVTGVSIGSNDLTQLMLGVDRDSELCAPLFDERDTAVLAAIEQIIAGCRHLGLTCSICGQAPSRYPEYVEQLVRWGIDSISVNPDAINMSRRHIAPAERKIELEAARSRSSDTS